MSEKADERKTLSRDIGPWYRYPPNGGVVPGTRVTYTDTAEYFKGYGVQVDRIGYADNRYLDVFENGKPGSFEQRSLLPTDVSKPYHQHTFTDNAAELMEGHGVRIEVSRVGPGFGRDGGGLRMRVLEFNVRENQWTPLTVEEIDRRGYLL